MPWKWTFCHILLANTAIGQERQHDDIIRGTMEKADWKKNESEQLGLCTACVLKSSLQPRNEKKCTS
jgi:hypothetical protein